VAVLGCSRVPVRCAGVPKQSQKYVSATALGLLDVLGVRRCVLAALIPGGWAFDRHGHEATISGERRSLEQIETDFA